MLFKYLYKTSNKNMWFIYINVFYTWLEKKTEIESSIMTLESFLYKHGSRMWRVDGKKEI